MKKTKTIFAVLILSVSMFLPQQANAQAPEKISYQTIVRDASNNLVASTAVGMRISILQTDANGTAVYVETYTPTTNANGLVSLEIGTGTPSTGTFEAINWANGPYFVKTEIDPANGTNYTITGTSQLLSVPYALHAKTAGINYEYNGKTGVRLLANDTATDVDLVLQAKGTGGLLAQQPDGSATGGDNRGVFSIDLQTIRAVSTQVASGNTSTVSGGQNNTASGDFSLVSGGNRNTASADHSTVSGGGYNTSSGSKSTVSGGFNNTASANLSTVSGGEGNTAQSYGETVMGVYATKGEGDSLILVATDRLLVVGNGSSTTPSDALTLLKNGDMTIAGNLTIGAYTLPATDGIAGQSLITKGTGDVQWKTLPGTSYSQSERDLLTAYAGLMVYNSTTNKPNYYNGTEWMNYDGTLAMSIGDSYQGGIIAYFLQPGDSGYDANVSHGIIAAPSDQSAIVGWGCVGTPIVGADGTVIGTGNQNTIDIMAGCATAGIAARICGDLTLDVYGDWYLPSADELYKLYINRVKIGGFVNDFYWSSTEHLDFLAIGHQFSTGSQFGTNKDYLGGYLRAVRAF